MRVQLTDAGAITLVEPQVFNRLDVLADPQSPERLEQAVASIGRREGEGHVWLSPGVLRFLSGHAGEPEWERGFAGMLAYAAGRGWVDGDGHVRAHLVMAPPPEVVAEAEFKAAMRALPAGVSVVTTGSGQEAAGMVVSSLTSISAQPPMVGFFMHRKSSMHAPLLANGRFVANVLGEQHREVMNAFLAISQGPARFARGEWAEGKDGLPVLGDALASLECDIVCTHALGTHDLVVGKVRRTTCSASNAMVHFNAATHVLQTEAVPA